MVNLDWIVGKTLRIPLECYLSLTCCKNMSNLLRLDDIKDYAQHINGESLGVSDLLNEISQLKW